MQEVTFCTSMYVYLDPGQNYALLLSRGDQLQTSPGASQLTAGACSGSTAERMRLRNATLFAFASELGSRKVLSMLYTSCSLTRFRVASN
mmetsp:Transcript_83363/g.156897  ORF Transcript_83363/g.156897 Transcript_83363/m.156897 type:complete len:90 (-) Transcript_83363:2850-3119(-)